MTEIGTAQIFGIIISIAVATIGWFVKRLFSDIEEVKVRSRNNERELFQKIAQTREEILKIEIERLKSKKDN